MLDHADHLTDGEFHPRLREHLAWIVRDADYDLVVTHNERGEYRHPQHRALHTIVRSLVPRDAALAVFDHHWRLRAPVSAAKRTLLAHYSSQRASIRRTWLFASRERLRRIR